MTYVNTPVNSPVNMNVEKPVSKAAKLSTSFVAAAFLLNLGMNMLIGVGTEMNIFAWIQVIGVPVLCLTGFIVGIVGIVQTAGGQRKGMGTAITGTCLSIGYLVLWVFLSGIYALYFS